MLSSNPHAVDELHDSDVASHAHPRDRTGVIIEGLKQLAWWSLRILVILAGTYVTWLLLGKFWRGILPVALAIIVTTVLWTPTQWLCRLKLPRAVAALITLLGSVGVVGAFFAFIAPSVAQQMPGLYFQGFEGIQRIELWLQGPPLNLHDEDLNNYFASGTAWLQNQSGTIAERLFAGLGKASSIVVNVGIVLVLTFFFLKDGDRFLPWLNSVVGRRAGGPLRELLARCWVTLSGFIRAQAIVSFVDAAFIGFGLVIMGIPLPLVLAMLTFFAGFVPIVGAFVAGALAVMVAFVAKGLTAAIVVLVIVVAVQQLEGNILSPLLQSRAMNLHPAVVLLSVTIGGSLFGILGAFFAVPVAAMVAVLLRFIGDMIDLKTGARTPEEVEFVSQREFFSELFPTTPARSEAACPKDE